MIIFFIEERASVFLSVCCHSTEWQQAVFDFCRNKFTTTHRNITEFSKRNHNRPVIIFNRDTYVNMAKKPETMAGVIEFSIYSVRSDRHSAISKTKLKRFISIKTDFKLSLVLIDCELSHKSFLKLLMQNTR